MLSASQAGASHWNVQDYNYKQDGEDISETQFDDRDDLQSASNIEEDIFSRGITHENLRGDTPMDNHESQGTLPNV